MPLLFGTNTPIPTYATLDDVSNTPGVDIRDDTADMLVFASQLVYKACRNDIYQTDENSIPLQDWIAGAMRDATVAQVGAWQVAHISYEEIYGGVATQKPSVIESQIATGHVTRDAAAVAKYDAARYALLHNLCPRATMILKNVDMATSQVGYY